MTNLRMWVAIFLYGFVISIEGLPLLRHKRQNMRQPRTSPSPQLRRLLENFWPEVSERCPPNYMICRDDSFCFNSDQLCGGEEICRDASDDVNAICLGRTTTKATSRSVTSSNGPPDRPLNPALGNEFSHPLVVAFFILVAGLFIYVAVATVCCVTHQWNSVNPSRMTS